MHTGTHCDAPRHVMEYEFDGRRARYSDEMPVDAYTGTAVVLKIDIEPWGLITDKHLDAACEKYGINQADLEGKIVCLNTGMQHTGKGGHNSGFIHDGKEGDGPDFPK